MKQISNTHITKRLGVSGLAVACLLTLSACGTSSSQSSKSQSSQNQAGLGTNAESSTDTTQDTAPMSADESAIVTRLQDNLNKSGLDAKVLSVTVTKMPNMYVAKIEGMAPIFTDSTGEFIIQGDVIQIGGASPVSLGGQINAELAKTELAALDTKDMIVYEAKGAPKTHVYVFSDPTCHYCQLLHKDIKEINDAGIEVRYLAWPRSEQVVPLVEAIWCSSDRKTSITAAKQNIDQAAMTLSQVPTCTNPVRAQMDLGFKLGVSGTPAIFAANGVQVGGYLPSDRLAQVAIENKS